MRAGQEHVDAVAHTDHAACDGGAVELHRQSAILAPVALDVAPPVCEIKFETLASAACGDRVPVFAFLEDKEVAAALVGAPAVAEAPGGKRIAGALRLLARADVELQPHHQ